MKKKTSTLDLLHLSGPAHFVTKKYAGPIPRLRPNLTYFPTTMRIEGSMHGSDHALSLN